MDCRNINFHFTLVSVFLAYCSSDGASVRSPVNIRDYIATESCSLVSSNHHFQAASEQNEAVHQKPPEELSRKEAIELLYSGSYFQDAFMEQLAPHKFQFGHVFENPQEWQQRFEQNDFDQNRFQGKVRWGNVKGDYGEHYWDLGHAGHK